VTAHINQQILQELSIYGAITVPPSVTTYLITSFLFTRYSPATALSVHGNTLNSENVMKVVVSVVNLIQSCGLNRHEFQSFLSETGTEYGDILYHTEV
jgi:hypothetical protein